MHFIFIINLVHTQPSIIEKGSVEAVASSQNCNRINMQNKNVFPQICREIPVKGTKGFMTTQNLARETNKHVWEERESTDYPLLTEGDTGFSFLTRSRIRAIKWLIKFSEIRNNVILPKVMISSVKSTQRSQSFLFLVFHYHKLPLSFLDEKYLSILAGRWNILLRSTSKSYNPCITFQSCKYFAIHFR